jgi:hypothetical protein
MVSEVVSRWMSERKAVLLSNYEAKGLKASGAFGQGVRIDSRGNEASMYAPIQVLMMIEGRKPNMNQDPKALKRFVGWAGSTFLKQWVQDRGLQVSPYAVAWSIARNGVQVPNSHNDGRLLTDTFTQESKEELFKSLTLTYVTELKSDIHKLWQ